MTTDVTTIDETASVGEALSLLEELDIRHLPVVRDGEVVGMVSDRDIQGLGLKLIHDIESLDRMQSRLTTPVSQLMSGDLVSVDPSTDLRDIVELMIDEKIGAVPVVDEERGRLAGIVSYVDCLRVLLDVLPAD